PPKWSAHWRWVIKMLIPVTGVALIAGTLAPSLFFWLFYCGCTIAAATLLILPDYDWRGFRNHRVIKSNVPVYALLPIGYREIMGLMSKICLVRFCAAIPILMALGAVAGWKHGIGFGNGILHGLELGL